MPDPVARNPAVDPAPRGPGHRVMDRCAFLGSLALGTILAVARVTSAQPARKVYRIGILANIFMTSDMTGPQPRNPSTNALL